MSILSQDQHWSTQGRNFSLQSQLLLSQKQKTIGFLVVDRHRRIVSLNRQLIELWSLPECLFRSRDDDQALEFVSQQFRNPQRFLNEVRNCYATPNLVINDTINLKNDKILERHSCPQLWEGKVVGRLWQFRELVVLN